MKDEIKEILKGIEVVIKHDGTLEFDAKELKVLLNYITNLQEENQRLKELDENYPIEEQLEEALKYEKIYKSRIDKAIIYIKKYLHEHVIEDFPDEQSIFYDEKDRYISNAKEVLLNILQGENNE